MSLSKVLTGFAVLFLAVSASAEGNKICMGGNLDQLNAAQVQACKQQVEQVRSAAERAGAANWHFVVVCDEAGWNDYAAFSNVSANVLKAANADTNAPQRTTFVRAGRIASSNMLAAELADIVRVSKPGTEMASLR